MSVPRIASLLLTVVAVGSACASLSWPEKDQQIPAAAKSDRDTAQTTTAAATTEPPASSWDELVRLAREARRLDDLESAEERLDQAALQVAALPAHHARRRTVFGLQCRLAVALAKKNEIERADALTERLLETAKAEPAIAGPALIQLARSLAARRDREGSLTLEDRVALLEVALGVAQAGAVDRERLQLALEVAEQAPLADRFALARQAIDQARNDARILRPSDVRLHANIELERARIALELEDVETAEKAATAANRLLEDVAGSEGLRGIGEITLARALARRGDPESAEKARLVAQTAEARLTADEPVTAHARRAILDGLARMAADRGETGAAVRLIRDALAIEPTGSPRDRYLVERLERDLARLTDDLVDAPAPSDATASTSTDQSGP